jgi:hypothetical protein
MESFVIIDSPRERERERKIWKSYLTLHSMSSHVMSCQAMLKDEKLLRGEKRLGCRHAYANSYIVLLPTPTPMLPHVALY